MSDSTLPDLPAADPWPTLRSLTTARIGLGRAGVSQPTRHHLAFQLAHAQARDAVHSELDVPCLLRELAAHGYDALALRSAAGDRLTYLQRPDLGRRLDEASAQRLAQASGNYDIAFIIADGLSALAIQRHSIPFLEVMLPLLGPATWRLAPITVVEHGRVAISDEIGALLGAEQAVILIGERPGLSSPDSLGIYLTYAPHLGNTDAQRNCISNIRDAGLSYAEAAGTLAYLLTEARRRRLSGVALKAEGAPGVLSTSSPRLARNFLVGEE